MSPTMKKICLKLAKQHRTTAEGIYQEMQGAIAEAFHTPQPEEVKDYRARIPRSSEIPTPEEVLAFLCQEIQGGGQSVD